MITLISVYVMNYNILKIIVGFGIGKMSSALLNNPHATAQQLWFLEFIQQLQLYNFGI